MFCNLIRAAVVLWMLGFFSVNASASVGIWISPAELAELPTAGSAWDQLKARADQPLDAPPNLSQQNYVNTQVLAKALVYARTGIETYRTEVVDALIAIIDTENRGDPLAVWRNTAAYVISADLVNMPPDEDATFKSFLRKLQTEKIDGKSIIDVHNRRPNNFGTHAGVGRMAIALYVGDADDLAKAAAVFKGWLGDRSSYAGFKYGDDLSWQCDPENPVGINPKSCTKERRTIDGVLPDDQRRSGSFTWPPPKANYVYGALDGALSQALILSRVGYDSWNWEDKALLRAFRWLHKQADFPPNGDNTWQFALVDYAYGTQFWDGSLTHPGKSMAWTDWTHSKRAGGIVGRSTSPDTSRRVISGAATKSSANSIKRRIDRHLRHRWWKP